MSRSRRCCPVVAWLSLGLAVAGCGAVAPAEAHLDAMAGVTPQATAVPAAVSTPASSAPGPGRPPADGGAATPAEVQATPPTTTTTPAASPGPTAPSPPTAPAAPDGPAVAVANDASVDPGHDVVARVQRLLLARGIAIGEVDGVLGERTRAGVAGFQQEAGLAATGALDGRTVATLEVASATFVAAMPASVVVDLSDQHATVANAAGAVVAVWPVSTGGVGAETPTGTFSVQSRVRVGEAKDAPTVHMDWFTVFDGDVGFHGIPWVGDRTNPLWTPLGRAAVSHGCVRMEDANAELLYTYLPDGAPVVVQA